MPTSLSELVPELRPLTLRNDHVEVTVLAGKGSDIYSMVDIRTGVDVMFKTPWGVRAPGMWSRDVTSMERWLEAYPGGWQLLLPNGGDECVERGATWGFHGEAALLPWTVLDRTGSAATLETRLFSAPLHVLRELSVDGPVLRLREVVTNESAGDIEIMWSHHPAFGAPFLDRECLLSAGCRSVLADDRAPGTLLSPGTRHPWPMVTTATGETIDLRQIPGPDEPRALLAYLVEFDSGYFAITNPRLRLGLGLRWPLEVFDNAWLWEEVHSSTGWPWFGRAYVVAVEPASTIPGHGMLNARAKGSKGAHLGGFGSREVVIEAVLFEGTGVVAAMEDGGVVRFVPS
jgi:hypothetical protein